jgi:Fructose-1,6-bisphosphatase
MHKGKMTEPVDALAHPFWDTIRDTVSNKAIGMRQEGFFGAAMLPMSDLEYTQIMEKLCQRILLVHAEPANAFSQNEKIKRPIVAELKKNLSVRWRSQGR